jgi:hypothetical protein
MGQPENNNEKFHSKRKLELSFNSESVVLRPDEKIRFLVIILLQLLGNGKTFSILVPPVYTFMHFATSLSVDFYLFIGSLNRFYKSILTTLLIKKWSP